MKRGRAARARELRTTGCEGVCNVAVAVAGSVAVAVAASVAVAVADSVAVAVADSVAAAVAGCNGRRDVVRVRHGLSGEAVRAFVEL